jgi:hypothetical protein
MNLGAPEVNSCFALFLILFDDRCDTPVAGMGGCGVNKGSIDGA